jgi:hypothetical protein
MMIAFLANPLALASRRTVGAATTASSKIRPFQNTKKKTIL